jgi:hypothetical protein
MQATAYGGARCPALDGMDITCLYDYSRAVAEEIFRRFPGWTAFATVESDPTEANYLLIEVPPPEEAVADQPLAPHWSSSLPAPASHFERRRIRFRMKNS